jgi:hypothetical protein
MKKGPQGPFCFADFAVGASGVKIHYLARREAERTR